MIFADEIAVQASLAMGERFVIGNRRVKIAPYKNPLQPAEQVTRSLFEAPIGSRNRPPKHANHEGGPCFAVFREVFMATLSSALPMTETEVNSVLANIRESSS